MSLPLAGLKVLDLTRLLPGPYATLVLAEMGARVDKLEDPAGGDGVRAMPPMQGEMSALFAALNRGKRSLTVDLKSSFGAQALKRLVRHYDVLLESFRPGVMEKLGLGYEALSAENPRLVYASITGFGQTGPDRLRAGHDIGYLARAGVLGYSGAVGGPPPSSGAQFADIGGSLFGLIGVLAALYERQRTGRGSRVDVSMTDAAVAFIHAHLATRLAVRPFGAPLTRGREPLNGGFACYGVYRCADGKFLSVGALEPKFYIALCQALGRPELATSGHDTGAAGQATRVELEQTFATRSRDEWLAVLAGHDVCVEPVWEHDEVLTDRQLQARGVIDGSTLHTPLRPSGAPEAPAPALGEHTAEVLREAGFTTDEIQRLHT